MLLRLVLELLAVRQLLTLVGGSHKHHHHRGSIMFLR